MSARRRHDRREASEKLERGRALRVPRKDHLLLVSEGTVYSPSRAVIEGKGVGPDAEIPACGEADAWSSGIR